MDAKYSLGEPRVLISREAILHNLALLRRTLNRTSPATRICAVLKADAYGHGANLVVDTVCNFAFDGIDTPLVDMLAVASIAEAEALNCAALPVLVLRPVENSYVGRQRAQIENAIRNGWILTICSPSAADDIARIAISCGKLASVQITLDTGMTRAGVNASDMDRLIRTVTGHLSLRLLGFCSHFACAENTSDDCTSRQLDVFRQVTDPIAQRFGGRVLRHIGNTGALFFHPASHLDMVRPGIGIYGIDPTCKPSLDRPLRPAMRWTAPLIGIRDVKKGTAVGYGQTWRAPRDTRLGLVPVGYADGYLRSFSNAASMILHGVAAPVAGMVSMDVTTIDIGNIPQAVIGDEVTVLDDDPLSPASVYSLARHAGTIPYEIFCHIGQRIHRVPVEAEEQPIEEEEESL